MGYRESVMVTIRAKQAQAARFEDLAARAGRSGQGQSARVYRLRAEYAHAEAEAMLTVARSL